eukprot:TRINITY_DN3828_c0_g1_i2.p3 TRINITY_DN3828_c0_g1~~TRINITY_DN3828_c0_g1_i2.p3  ORF type:complete len:116 (-),score=20.48 TRINITY_DN3828_c0_g1_i2:105-452(-)
MEEQILAQYADELNKIRSQFQQNQSLEQNKTTFSYCMIPKARFITSEAYLNQNNIFYINHFQKPNKEQRNNQKTFITKSVSNQSSLKRFLQTQDDELISEEMKNVSQTTKKIKQN